MASLYGLAGKLVADLCKLCSPLFSDYVGKPWLLGTKSEFEKLKTTLEAIQAVLLDADERQKTNHQVRLWLERIKLVFYDLEDLLQEVNYEALKRQVMAKNKNAKEVHIFFSSSNQIMYRFKMGRKVKLIIEKLDAIAESNKFSLAQRFEEMPATTSHKREETHSFVLVDKFIGREKDKEKVKNLLLTSDGLNNVSVISVVGIGGMGKTTLAQSIYNLEEVKGNFELMMWVCVSDPFDVKLICENIIKSATQNQCRGLPMDVVKNKLKSSIDGKKYLLVLDDVWNKSPDEWMKLEVLLACGAKGCKILVTTREKLVARTANSIEIHVLEGLPQDKSWDLFKQVAFKQGMEPQSSTIAGIGNEVVERCSGVPLVIKTIGSLLGLKEREADWVDFQKNDLPLVTKDSDREILPILKLSYDNLTAPLKRCFAYCAIFPKDWEIEKETLIRMWMAQGLIQSDGTRRSLEDVGEKHFMDLRDRSLFEVYGSTSDYGRAITCCKMHDLIHDLALSLGREEFWTNGSDVNDIGVTTRHACVSNRDPSISTKLLHAKKLQTLVTEDVTIGDFKRIRVLYIRFAGMFRVPDFVGGLRFLNYLNLSGSHFGSIPESISSMYNLQTLILNDCFNLKELPKGTRNLVSLRHLVLSECDNLSHMPRGMGDLTSLRTLTDFVIGPEGADCSELGELKKLVKLRGELKIRNLRDSKVAKCRSSGECCYPTPLAELQFITGLELRWCCEDEIDKKEEEEADELEILKPHPNLESLKLVNYGGKGFPSWMDGSNIRDSLPKVRSIVIYGCEGWRHLPPLGLLPSLRELTVASLACMNDLQYMFDKEDDEELDNSNNRHFPALEKLRIQDCPLLVVDGKQFMSVKTLREVDFRGDIETLSGLLPYLPHLQILDLFFCYDNVMLPESIGDLKSLQEIRLTQCRTLASIPDCMQHLTSLQTIRLQNCYSIESIPDCVLHLTSLQRIEISGCNNLYRRYNKESGEDRHKIAHIPHVSVSEW